MRLCLRYSLVAGLRCLDDWIKVSCVVFIVLVNPRVVTVLLRAQIMRSLRIS